MSRCYIAKGIARGTAVAPPSKSYAHRLLLAAFLGGRRTTVSNIDLSNDISATIDCIKALGGIVSTEGSSVTVERGAAKADAILPCRESGSTLRFMIPVALALTGSAQFTGTAKLFSRGIGEYEKIFAAQGIKYTLGADSLKVEGHLDSGSFTIDGATSSQYITGLLFALPMLGGESQIHITPPVQSRPYIDITLDVLRQAGVAASFEGNTINVAGGQRYALPDTEVEGDWSNAAFLDFYNHIGGEVTVKGLNPDSLQGDRVYRELFQRLEGGFCTIDIGNCIDLGPVLFTMAAVKHGALFENTARLRIKESDRICDIARELEKTGAQVITYDNSVKVVPVAQEKIAALSQKSIIFDSHNDHRLAMSLTALASMFGASLQGCESVAKSFPSFFEVVKHLNIDVRHE